MDMWAVNISRNFEIKADSQKYKNKIVWNEKDMLCGFP